MSKRGQKSPSKVRMMAMALVDESGLRWEFDTSFGKRINPSEEYDAGIYRRGPDEIAVISLIH